MSDSSADRPENRLARETSPYLLQHKNNPVDWFPWGEEAFELARATDRPLFLSVGYSACHWCHVMERESFENEAIAALMNEHFVNVKVDREERPDVDNIYMAAVQAMTQHGGWPMSVFLTPDGKPFFGGTYYPPSDGRGMPGFPRVLLSVAQAWKDRRDDIDASAGELTELIRGLGMAAEPSTEELGEKLLDGAYRTLSNAFDPANGGFGDAPKFPHPMDLKVLLRHHARTGDVSALNMVKVTLDKMSRGGIYDHLGGGFARYSTDERWLAPHFEKMLYDNALLTSVYVEAFQQTRDPQYARVARETIGYVLSRMTGPEGGFFSTEDADSEGVEGKYYVWSRREIRDLLGEERSEIFSLVYDVSDRGNWEHQNILNLPRPISEVAARLRVRESDLRRDLDEDRAILLAARERRVPPGKDTKVLASWNGLMIAALADASHALGDSRYRDAAAQSAGFVLEKMRAADGKLLHSFKDNQAKLNGYLDDYANIIDGLTRLSEATGESRWLSGASELSEILMAEFLDREQGGFYYTGSSHEALIARQRDAMDNATPSGNAMAATALLRLAALTGNETFRQAGVDALRSVRGIMGRHPSAAGQSLIAVDFLLAPTREFAVVQGADRPEFEAVLAAIASRFLPHKVVAPSPAGESAISPLLEGRGAREGRVTTYICENSACREPVVGVEGLEAVLKEA